jgi:hypothetical protein
MTPHAEEKKLQLKLHFMSQSPQTDLDSAEKIRDENIDNISAIDNFRLVRKATMNSVGESEY